MAANINSFAGVIEQETRKASWHGLGVEVEQNMTSKQALVLAGLDWKAEKVGLQDFQGNPIANHFAIRRSDNKETIGIVGNQYEPIQNVEAFDCLDAVIGEHEAFIETAGALGRGERVWMMAKMKGFMLGADGNDPLAKYLLLSNTHDGTDRVRIILTSVRVVCQNTLSLSLRENKGKAEFTMKHNDSLKNKELTIRRILGIVPEYEKLFQDAVAKMQGFKLSEKAAIKYFEEVGFDNAEKGRARGNFDTILELFRKGTGNKGENLWHAVNAITEYNDYFRATRVTASNGNSKGGDKETSTALSRLESAWFGSGKVQKDKAWDIAQLMVA
jgi:phage/plasmid-like protein (TIGR03299 family)